MSKFIILRGLPASGKSTWVKEYLNGLDDKERAKTVVISKDSIRDATGTYWVPSRENYILAVENGMIIEALKRDFNIISDNTNLNSNRITEYLDLIHDYSIHDYIVKIVDMEVSLKEAIARDKERAENGGRSVTENVIKRFYYYMKSKKFIKSEDLIK